MPPVLGIWDTENCLEVGPTKLLIISNVATTGGYRFYSERGALAKRNGHDKES
jgi:hypothetical protein